MITNCPICHQPIGIPPRWHQACFSKYPPSHPWYYFAGGPIPRASEITGDPLQVILSINDPCLSSSYTRIIDSENLPESWEQRAITINAKVQAYLTDICREIEHHAWLALHPGRPSDEYTASQCEGNEEELRLEWASELSFVHNHIWYDRTHITALKHELSLNPQTTLDL